MPQRSLKSHALTALAVSALLALGACGEKVDDAAAPRTTPPSSNSDMGSTPSATPGSGMGGSMPPGSSGSGMAMPPEGAASGARN